MHYIARCGLCGAFRAKGSQNGTRERFLEFLKLCPDIINPVISEISDDEWLTVARESKVCNCSNDSDQLQLF